MIGGESALGRKTVDAPWPSAGTTQMSLPKAYSLSVTFGVGRAPTRCLTYSRKRQLLLRRRRPRYAAAYRGAVWAKGG